MQALERDDNVFIEEPDKEDVDMEVELGVNLFDAFTMKHADVSKQLSVASVTVDSCGLLLARRSGDGERFNSASLELDDVAQEVLSSALLEDDDVSDLEIDDQTPPFPEWEDPKTGKMEMVVFLYAFEKFRIVYA